MRDLIQPALKIMARTGLFLSVAAWVVGQWWRVQAHGPGLLAGLCEYGWEVGIVQSLNTVGASYVFTSERSEDQYIFFFSDFIWASNSQFGLYFWNKPGEQVLTIRHWLIVTIFATFYGVLKWVYRKRGREAVGNE